jgi:hypothetical protein
MLVMLGECVTAASQQSLKSSLEKLIFSIFFCQKISFYSDLSLPTNCLYFSEKGDIRSVSKFEPNEGTKKWRYGSHDGKDRIGWYEMR